MEPVELPSMVDHPTHYLRHTDKYLLTARDAVIGDDTPDHLNLECIEAMLSRFISVDQIRGFLIGNSFKYRWRYEGKGGVQDLEKAEWYEKRLLKLEKAVRAVH